MFFLSIPNLVTSTCGKKRANNLGPNLKFEQDRQNSRESYCCITFPAHSIPGVTNKEFFLTLLKGEVMEKKKISGLNNKKSIPNIAQIIDIWILGREWLEMCFCYDVRPTFSNSKM